MGDKTCTGFEEGRQWQVCRHLETSNVPSVSSDHPPEPSLEGSAQIPGQTVGKLGPVSQPLSSNT